VTDYEGTRLFFKLVFPFRKPVTRHPSLVTAFVPYPTLKGIGFGVMSDQ